MLSPRLYYLGILELICLFQVGCSRNASRPCLAIKDEPSCVCFHPDGEGIINGTLLALKPPYAPKFKGLLDQYKYEYSLNPCYPYSQGLCANVHSCQTSLFNKDVTYNIASGGTELMYVDPDGIPYLYYTGPGGRATFVYLHCTSDKTPRVEAKGDSAVFFKFVFHVYSRDICPYRNSTNWTLS